MKTFFTFKRPMKVIMLSMGLFISASVYTYESGAPTGYTNAPGEGNCSSCHASTPITSGTVWSGITLTKVGGSLASITANASNAMNLSFSSSSSTKFGFQLCVLPSTAGSTTASVGSINIGTSTLVQTATATSPARTYLSQTSNGAAASSGTASWNFNWVTPVSYAGGATFYVVINEANGNNSSSGDQIYLKTFSTTVLPVRWLDFSAQEANDGILLKWSTASEINNKYFEIERSRDGINFESAGKVNGIGNTNTITSYRFLDEINPNSTWFYRLKQVDFDGKEDTSKVITFQTSSVQAPYVYSNSDNNQLFIQSENPVNLVRVFSLSGNLVSRIEGDGNNQFKLSEELKGVYLIEVQIGSNSYYKKLLF